MAAVVQIKNLIKKYDDFTAVNIASLEINENECFGLLGPKGSGKSSLAQILYGSSSLTEGDAFVLGLNVQDHIAEIKARIGVIPQEMIVDDELSVTENLKIYAQFYELSVESVTDKISSLLRSLKIEDKAEHSIRSLSLLSKKKLSIALGLINSPDLLFIDEPTLDLDPTSKKWILNFLKDLKQQKLTFILTTENETEAELLCDKVALVDQGKILVVGEPAALIQELVGKEVVEFDCEPQDINYYVQKLKEQKFEYQVFQSTVMVFIGSGKLAKEVLSLVTSSRIMLRKPSLNDVFLRLSGSKLGNS